jgi:hypothetical protein
MGVVVAAWIIVGTRLRSSVKSMPGGRERLGIAMFILSLLASQT